MIVNNWQAFLDAYSRYTTGWSKIYFVCWWLTSSVMWVNLFVALILENFIYRWDRSHSCSNTDVERIRYETSVQLIFKSQVQEPTEEELLFRLSRPNEAGPGPDQDQGHVSEQRYEAQEQDQCWPRNRTSAGPGTGPAVAQEQSNLAEVNQNQDTS
ncbi:hypothetical protein fugu_002811 [Takifugu bimaculatus]|uniref:Ion transport domain-containing protein n=1 Tax=Takifugu bimaculatus TaxID=433685 RepID=A0A4Z2BEX6_9TELE|nr:hypothetical protein fugu_002811 [Takifugu bimaculatus]